MKCISNIIVFFMDYFQQCTFIFLLRGAARRILMEESPNKHVIFDLFIFFFLLWCIKQPACMFVCFLLFLLFHIIWQKKPESKYKNTKAVTQKPQHTSASFHFYITFIWQICLSFQRYEFTVRLNMEINCFNLCKLVFAKKMNSNIEVLPFKSSLKNNHPRSI